MPPPQRERSAIDQFKDSLEVVRAAKSVVAEFSEMMPSERGETPVADEQDDDSPVRIVKTAVGDLLYGKQDNELRKWDSLLANSDKILKWVGEQREAFQRSQAERQRQQQQAQRRVLPPGYVEVTEDYQAPPGFTAVPVTEVPEHRFPPPPTDLPAPVQAAPAESPRRTWGVQ
jgi:hypothetical protein